MPEHDVPAHGAKERDPSADEHWNPRDNEALNQAGVKKPLDGDSAVDVHMADAASLEEALASDER